MKIIKSENDRLRIACDDIRESRQLKSRAEVLENAAKNTIRLELASRGINLDKLNVGDVVIIKLRNSEARYDDCFCVTVKGQNRVDLSKLRVDYPRVEADCRREFPTVFMEPLLQQPPSELERKQEELQRTIESINITTEAIKKQVHELPRVEKQ